MLRIGDLAPDFTLPDQAGRPFTLSEQRGSRVVLYFYPKDNTPGCTRQACAYAGLYSEFERRGVKVVGISRDSTASHSRFAEKHALPFTLLSDPDRIAIEAYGVWQKKKLYGKTSLGIVRTTYLIGEDGRIEAVLPKVKPDVNAAEVLALL